MYKFQLRYTSKIWHTLVLKSREWRSGSIWEGRLAGASHSLIDNLIRCDFDLWLFRRFCGNGSVVSGYGREAERNSENVYRWLCLALCSCPGLRRIRGSVRTRLNLLRVDKTRIFHYVQTIMWSTNKPIRCIFDPITRPIWRPPCRCLLSVCVGSEAAGVTSFSVKWLFFSL